MMAINYAVEYPKLQRKLAELEALNRRLTERWEGAKLRYAEDSQRIGELEVTVKRLEREVRIEMGNRDRYHEQLVQAEALLGKEGGDG